MSEKPAIPLPAADALKKLMAGECLQSWVVKLSHLATDCDLAPGIDLVTFLEGSDGALNQLRVVFGVAKQTDAPKIDQETTVRCRLSVLWNEVEVVNRVLLPFKSHPSLSAFLLLLISALSHLNDAVEDCWDDKEKGEQP